MNSGNSGITFIRLHSTKKEIVTRLFDELRKHYPKFESDELSNEALFQKILPGEKYDYFKLKNAISDLFILGKDFFYNGNELNLFVYTLTSNAGQLYVNYVLETPGMEHHTFNFDELVGLVSRYQLSISPPGQGIITLIPVSISLEKLLNVLPV